jgi:hypothetical protein
MPSSWKATKLAVVGIATLRCSAAILKTLKLNLKRYFESAIAFGDL